MCCLLFHLMRLKLANSGGLYLLREHPGAPLPTQRVREGKLRAVDDAPLAPGAGTAATACVAQLEEPRLPGTCSARTSAGGGENLPSQQLCFQSGAAWRFYPAKMWNFMSFCTREKQPV